MRRKAFIFSRALLLVCLFVSHGSRDPVDGGTKHAALMSQVGVWLEISSHMEITIEDGLKTLYAKITNAGESKVFDEVSMDWLRTILGSRVEFGERLQTAVNAWLKRLAEECSSWIFTYSLDEEQFVASIHGNPELDIVFVVNLLKATSSMTNDKQSWEGIKERYVTLEKRMNDEIEHGGDPTTSIRQLQSNVTGWQTHRPNFDSLKLVFELLQKKGANAAEIYQAVGSELFLAVDAGFNAARAGLSLEDWKGFITTPNTLRLAMEQNRPTGWLNELKSKCYERQREEVERIEATEQVARHVHILDGSYTPLIQSFTNFLSVMKKNDDWEQLNGVGPGALVSLRPEADSALVGSLPLIELFIRYIHSHLIPKHADDQFWKTFPQQLAKVVQPCPPGYCGSSPPSTLQGKIVYKPEFSKAQCESFVGLAQELLEHKVVFRDVEIITDHLSPWPIYWNNLIAGMHDGQVCVNL